MRFASIFPGRLSVWAEAAQAQFPAAVEIVVSSDCRHAELRCGDLRPLKVRRADDCSNEGRHSCTS